MLGREGSAGGLKLRVRRLLKGPCSTFTAFPDLRGAMRRRSCHYVYLPGAADSREGYQEGPTRHPMSP